MKKFRGLLVFLLAGECYRFKQGAFFYHYQPMERTWEKNYTSEEWEDGKCLNVYVMIPDMERQEIPVIEDELNHRLHMAGYDFYIHFWAPSFDEMFGEDMFDENPQGGQSSDELVAQKNSQGMRPAGGL